jgi:trans-aconitate 2-methyltransferase
LTASVDHLPPSSKRHEYERDDDGDGFVGNDMTWDPQQYGKFAGERLRPALDLAARIPLATPRTIVDLGCGSGNVTAILAQRWPDARVTGVDNSSTMLAKARGAAANVDYVEADLGTWTPPTPVDLVFSNAALHWLPDHARLFPRLLTMIAPGGALAVQMPSNFHAPSHATIATLAARPRWSARLAPRLRAAPVGAPDEYFRWLAPHAAALDVWTTEYLQVLPPQPDGHPVAAFTRGSWLPQFLEALAPEDVEPFLAEYSTLLAQAYPPLPDGRVLFPFRRLFLVAILAGKLITE